MASLPTLMRRLEALESRRSMATSPAYFFDAGEGCTDKPGLTKALAEGRKAIVFKWRPAVEPLAANRI